MTGPDITAVLLAHAQGPLVGISLASVLDAAATAREDGIEVEVLVVLRQPDAATAEALAEAESHGARVLRTDAASEGEARNEAVAAARGRYLSLLDGGDLWSANWLSAAYAVCESDPGRTVAHPEVSWLFGTEAEVFFGADQADPAFDPRLLRVEDPWDPVCLEPREQLLAAPFGSDVGDAEDSWRRHHRGLGTVLRRTAPETIHFVRYDDDDRERPSLRLTGELLRPGRTPTP